MIRARALRFGCLIILAAAPGLPPRAHGDHANSAGAEFVAEPIDLAPFALPRTPAGELRFEDPHEFERVVVTFADAAPETVTLSYLQRTWPEVRPERFDFAAQAMGAGWLPIDDHYNTQWRPAQVRAERLSTTTLALSFEPIASEFPIMPKSAAGDSAGARERYRRTLGLRVEATTETVGATVRSAPEVRSMAVFSRSPARTSTLLVSLDAGRITQGERLAVRPYLARVETVRPIRGVRFAGDALALGAPPTDVNGDGQRPRALELTVSHMDPAHEHAYDDGLLTFELAEETFTISLEDLERRGPIWFEEAGVFVTLDDHPETFEQYRARFAGRRTIAAEVASRGEQSLAGVRGGQYRAHPTAFPLGVKLARQKFILEANGDLVMRKLNLTLTPGRDSERFHNEGDARMRFGLERDWLIQSRAADAAPVPAVTIEARRGDLRLTQRVVAAPLLTVADRADDVAGDDPIVCLLRFRFENDGDSPVVAELPLGWQGNSGRSTNRLEHAGGLDDWQVPKAPREPLTLEELPRPASGALPQSWRLVGQWQGRPALRAQIETTMRPAGEGATERPVLRQELAPGAACEVVVKVPFITLESDEELRALSGLDVEETLEATRRFWREESRRGARLTTPEPLLDALHQNHLTFVNLADFKMPGAPELINTSVGHATYPNYTNESCMIIQDLEERGLHDEARRRLEVWLKYQGTRGLVGSYTDHAGVFFGAGGYEMGDSYSQHHGWAMWCLARHYFYTRDEAWLLRIAPQLLAAVDWVGRQRAQTLVERPFSRGWERGFLAPGGLEDVGDFFYWLSTNTMTWRGVEHVARALEAIGHPEAARVRAEADDYARCLRAGFETARQMAPLVPLRDGRWVPDYPSRLYRRGRDLGWIREVLEGSVYLVLSGLYAPDSKQAGWILDDYQENRYLDPRYGYAFHDRETNWFDYGGFSNQPCLLAGPLPHLMRDEPEIYIWMVFNSLVACWREELGGLIEHPMPILGFSNQPPTKPSDEANLMKWLRYMIVWCDEDAAAEGEDGARDAGPAGLLHLGRALPREWLTRGPVALEGAVTPYGRVSVRYEQPGGGDGDAIRAEVDLDLHRAPGRLLLRLRDLQGRALREARVNGQPHAAFDAARGDVDLTGQSGKLIVEGRF